jgi:glycosyltransferase involved in cell wall biosynthesis
MSMKIGFDVSDLCTGRADGTTRFTQELAKRFPVISAENDWHYFAPGKIDKETSNVNWHSSPWPKYWTQLRLPFDLYKYKPDVLFMPIQQIPYLRPGKMKTVAVIHDLAVHYYPEYFTYKDWLLLHVFSAYAAREADEIITVSQATADDVKKFYGRTNNVHVVHHGVDNERFGLPSEEEKVESWNMLVSKYPNFKKPYILYVGQIQPRKNLVRLIEAFEKVKKDNSELQLVVAGSHGWLNKEIKDRVKESKFKESILMPGRVDDELLPALYWHAEAYVLPSLYEGFGMPILEAFGCGCPVVTSNISSMPEVAGEAAVLVEPRSVDSIAGGINEAIDRKDELKQLGLERVKDFSWDKTTRQVLDVIKGG